MSAPSFDMEALLLAARKSEPVKPGEKADVLARLERSLALPLSNEIARHASSSGLFTFARLKWLAAFAGTFALGSATHAFLSRASDVPIAKRYPTYLLTMPKLPTVTFPSPHRPRADRTPPTATTTKNDRLDAMGGQLALEITLLDTARTALGRGDFGNAEAALSRHRSRFPTGQLKEERDRIATAIAAARKTSGEGRDVFVTTDEARRK